MSRIEIMCNKFHLDDLKLWEEFKTQHCTKKTIVYHLSADSSIHLLGVYCM